MHWFSCITAVNLPIKKDVFANSSQCMMLLILERDQYRIFLDHIWYLILEIRYIEFIFLRHMKDKQIWKLLCVVMYLLFTMFPALLGSVGWGACGVANALFYFAECLVVDKPCILNNHNMTEGCFSHLFSAFLPF